MLTDKFCARKIVLSSTVKELESYAIPTRTKELVLNEGLEILDDSALLDSSITVLKLPSTLKKIGDDAFSLYKKKITGNCKEVEVTDKTFISAGDLRVLELAGVKNIQRDYLVNAGKLQGCH